MRGRSRCVLGSSRPARRFGQPVVSSRAHHGGSDPVDGAVACLSHATPHHTCIASASQVFNSPRLPSPNSRHLQRTRMHKEKQQEKST